MRTPRYILGLCALLLALLYGAPSAFAHATPISYEPEAEAILETVPQTVRIIFSERVEPKASSITVYSPDGKTVNHSDGMLDPLDGHVFWTSFTPAGNGTYAVSWQVVSADDGHFSKGAFIFSVGQTDDNSAFDHLNKQPEVVFRSPASEAFVIGLELLGQALLWSLILLLPVLHRLLLPDPFCRCRTGLFVLAGVLCILAGSAGYIGLQSRTLAEVQNTGLTEGIWKFIQTKSGSFAALRGLAGIIFGLAYLVLKKKLHISSLSRSHFILALIILLAGYLRARISHAAASSVLPEFSIMVNFVHLAAKQAWIGGAVLAAFWIMPLLKKLGRIPEAATFARIFSRMTAMSIGIGGVTGAYIIWLHLKGFDNVLTTDWGLRFVVLSGLAGLFFGVRLYQQYLRGQIFLIEAVVGLAVLFSSSLLIITTPPLTAGHTFTRNIITTGGEIRLMDAPDGAPIFLLEFSSDNGSIRQVVIAATNNERNVGPIVIPASIHHAGTYAFEKKHLTPPGNWQLDITAQRTSGYDLAGTFKFSYPADIAAAREKLAEKSSGPFEGLILISLVGLIIVSRRLYKDAV